MSSSVTQPITTETEPEAKRESGYLVCDFCKCKLAKTSGENVVRKSPEAKAFEKAVEDAETWKAKYEAVKAELDAKNNPAPSPEPSKASTSTRPKLTVGGK